ncbi:MAG: pyridoxal phosphate-dependent aminotransferase, partial [Thermomicrobiales bacterium]|nr:pyridoxal phosphate-dependent aminotransferase [Thermomicrobiales bacterium]
MKLATRMSRLGTETAFEVLVRARALEAQGKDVIHLEVGEPDFDTPQNVIEAGVDALRNGWTHYGPAAGQPDFRTAIANYLNTARGTSFDLNNIVVTPGGKPIMFFVILALLEAGDEAIYPNPGFPIYESMINFTGATAVPAPILEENDFALDVDGLEALISPRTKLLIINSPSNPTGGVLNRDEIARIAELAVKHDLIVMADEIYAEILFEGEHVSIATMPGMAERTIILDGFSKTYAMTGWRLGYGVMPKSIAPAISRLVTNSVSCTAHFTQTAGVAALTGPQAEVERMVDEFRQRRQVIVDGLNSIKGLRCRLPAGAFYAFPNITGTGLDSKTFATRLLDEHGVAALSGTAFGRHGEGYIRLSY